MTKPTQTKRFALYARNNRQNTLVGYDIRDADKPEPIATIWGDSCEAWKLALQCVSFLNEEVGE